MSDTNHKSTVVEISSKTILRVLFIFLLLLFLYAIKNILAIVFVAFVLASALDPWIDSLQAKKIPRSVGILLMFIIGLGIFSFVISLLIPPISEQIQALSKNFPKYYEQTVSSFSSIRDTSEQYGFPQSAEQGISSLSSSLDNFTRGIFTTLASIFGGFVSFFGVLVLTFYMTVEEDGMKKFLRSIAPVKYQPYLIHKIHQIQYKLGQWLRGQIFLCIIIGILAYIGLLILGVHYALVLALLAGILEFIPVIGPILGAIPAIFLAFTQSPFKALLVLILYIVIQQLENQVIVPKVMQKSVGLNPIIIILSMLIGARLGGLFGVVLAVPAATILSIFFVDFFEDKKVRDNRLTNDPDSNM